MHRSIIQSFNGMASLFKKWVKLIPWIFVLLLLGCNQSDQNSSGVSSSGVSNSQEGDGGEQGLQAPLSLNASGNKDAEPSKVVVYTARKEHLVKGLFDAFTSETGVEVEYITDKAQPLIARMRAEGDRTPADLFIAVDAGNLWQAVEQNLLRSVDSNLLSEKVPSYLRDPEGRWFGLSQRARTLVYSTQRVKKTDLSTYEALAEPQFKGRLCLRTAKKIYNQSLVAILIARVGVTEAERIVKGWVDNLATQVFSNDTAVIKAINAGQCDVGVVNSYYFGALLQEYPDMPSALFWANQEANGTHVNISGAGVTKYAKNPQGALRLLEWMVSDKAQQMLALSNYEYPVVEGVVPSELVQSWGEFKSDRTHIELAGKYQGDAIKVMDRAGYK